MAPIPPPHPQRLLAALRDPTTQTDLLQIAKTVIAAVGAWSLSVDVLGLDQPFLASWAALLTVHATVYRSLSEGVQSVFATAIGIGLSFVVAQALGVGVLTLAVTMLLGLMLSRTRLLPSGGVTIATTAIFVVTTGYVSEEPVLLLRLADTGVGVVSGLLVNLVVVPPLNDRSAERRIHRIDTRLGALLSDMAAELRQPWSSDESQAWIDRTREMDDELQRAWELVRHARESARWNPRRRWSRTMGDISEYERVLRRIEEGIAQARSMARTIDESTHSAQEWDSRFREPWLDLLAETGSRISDPDSDVGAMGTRVDDLTRELSGEELPGLLWPVYGALIANLLNIINVVDDVATARPVRT